MISWSYGLSSSLDLVWVVQYVAKTEGRQFIEWYLLLHMSVSISIFYFCIACQTKKEQLILSNLGFMYTAYCIILLHWQALSNTHAWSKPSDLYPLTSNPPAEVNSPALPSNYHALCNSSCMTYNLPSCIHWQAILLHKLILLHWRTIFLHCIILLHWCQFSCMN